VAALGTIGSPKAIDSLIKLLKKTPEYIQGRAANSLGMIGDRRATEALIKSLNDEESHVRNRAAQALGRIKDERAVNPLLDALKDPDSIVRYRAIEALGEIGDIRAISALETLKIKPPRRKRRGIKPIVDQTGLFPNKVAPQAAGNATHRDSK